PPRAQDRLSPWQPYHLLVRRSRRTRFARRALDRRTTRAADRDSYRDHRRPRSLVDPRHDRGCARALCPVVLAPRLRQRTVLADFQDPRRRPGLLRRPDRRVAGLPPLRSRQAASALEDRRRPCPQHCPGPFLWPDRLPNERLLLWTRLRPSLGDSFPR